MRIVDRQTFLSLPPNTVYQKYEPIFFGSISIKMESLETDWVELDVSNPDFAEATDSGRWAMLCCEMEEGASFPLYMESCGRDGLFDQNQLFAVWEPHDIELLIEKLRACLPVAS